MRRPACLAALITLALPAPAHAAAGRFFPGETIDGPSADIQVLGDLDVARDGTGALVYVKRDAGADHVFAARLAEGRWQAPERVDGGLAAAASQPVVAASANGRLTVVFQNAAGVYAVVRPDAGSAWTAPQLLGASGRSPAVDMSVNGVAYATWTGPGTSAADVFAARLERTAGAFTGLPAALDIAPAADAGAGGGRSRVAVAADGAAVATWGEAGRVYARRLFEYRLSTAPQDLTLPALAGAPGGAADAPDVGMEDDSSYAWVAFRQVFGGTPRAIARRLVGSQFEAPAVIDDGQAAGPPRIDVSGRGDGYGAVASLGSNGALASALKDDAFAPPVLLGGGFGAPPAPAPIVVYTGDGAVAYQQGEPDGTRTIRLRPYDFDARSRAVTQPGAPVPISDPALGLPDAARGLDGAANRAGDLSVAFVQGDGAARRIVAASFDRAPGTFGGYTTTRWRRASRPTLSWGASFELWGPLTYRVELNGLPLATTGATRLRPQRPIGDGVYRWRVVAIDRRGQATATRTRTLRIDATKPRIAQFSARRRGRTVAISVRASDAARRGARASGVGFVRIDWGDGSRRVTVKSARARLSHAYGRRGRATVRVSATDRAGNAVAVTRRVTVG